VNPAFLNPRPSFNPQDSFVGAGLRAGRQTRERGKPSVAAAFPVFFYAFFDIYGFPNDKNIV
jgi:hypothetical protein